MVDINIFSVITENPFLIELPTMGFLSYISISDNVRT